jgi:prophage antirepressor-like protein
VKSIKALGVILKHKEKKMSNLSSFQFNNNQVRVVMIDGEPWFVLTDVLQNLDSNTKVTEVKASICEGLGKEFVNTVPLQTNGGLQDTTIISEAGLTFWVSRGRTELAKKMNRWIHKEVLPSIRKTGKYEIPQKQELPQLDSPDTALKAAKAVDEIQRIIGSNQPRLAQMLIEVAVNDALKILQPKENNALQKNNPE